MEKDKLVGSTYINIIRDNNGQIKFAYGYEMDDKELSLNDFAMLNSFLDKIKAIAEQDFNDRLDINEKEFSIESKPED